MEPIASQWDPIENFQARPDDLIISTYPKAGEMLWGNIVRGKVARTKVRKIERRVER